MSEGAGGSFKVTARGRRCETYRSSRRGLQEIIIGTSLLSLCLGENSNLAISSVSFHRDDAPLSYKYNYVHPYSTGKPKSQNRPEIYKNIQYAPLVPNHIDKDKNDGVYTKAVAYKWNDIQNITRNENLEPQVHGSNNNYGNRQFVSGYNIDVPKRNNFGYNSISSEYKNVATSNKGTQLINFNKNTKNIPSNKLEISQDQLNNMILIKARKHQKQPSKSMQVLSMIENSQIHPVFNPYVKVPKLHLNIARANKFAPIKAPISGYQNMQQNFEQAHVKYSNRPALQKTILYPMNK
ncbi:unnamed protein product [Euphydryas editha]|uniref:Uncharacterized protein n=1 Tax=Euphydryas editha TaxID=104508 RepID=A0AAU9V8R9_EUPED|nr:unnamed protein product [Euphydryas editha]